MKVVRNPVKYAHSRVSAVTMAYVSEKLWLNTDEAASRLGITTRTLYRFMDQGDIASYRMGRVFRLRADDVESFITECRVSPGSLSHLYPTPKGAEEHGELGADSSLAANASTVDLRDNAAAVNGASDAG